MGVAGFTDVLAPWRLMIGVSVRPAWCQDLHDSDDQDYKAERGTDLETRGQPHTSQRASYCAQHRFMCSCFGVRGGALFTCGGGVG